MRVANLRKEGKSFEKFVNIFDESVKKAEESVSEIKHYTENSSKAIEENVQKARMLANDLAFSIEKGAKQAKQLRANIQEAELMSRAISQINLEKMGQVSSNFRNANRSAGNFFSNSSNPNSLSNPISANNTSNINNAGSDNFGDATTQFSKARLSEANTQNRKSGKNFANLSKVRVDARPPSEGFFKADAGVGATATIGKTSFNNRQDIADKSMNIPATNIPVGVGQINDANNNAKQGEDKQQVVKNLLQQLKKRNKANNAIYNASGNLNNSAKPNPSGSVNATGNASMNQSANQSVNQPVSQSMNNASKPNNNAPMGGVAGGAMDVDSLIKKYLS